MSEKKVKQYPGKLKAKIILEVLKSEQTVAQIASEYKTHPKNIHPTSYFKSKSEHKTQESWALQMGDNFRRRKGWDVKKMVDFFSMFGHFGGEGKANFSFFVEKNTGLNTKKSLSNELWAKLNILKLNPVFEVSDQGISRKTNG